MHWHDFYEKSNISYTISKGTENKMEVLVACRCTGYTPVHTLISILWRRPQIHKGFASFLWNLNVSRGYPEPARVWYRTWWKEAREQAFKNTLLMIHYILFSVYVCISVNYVPSSTYLSCVSGHLRKSLTWPFFSSLPKGLLFWPLKSWNKIIQKKSSTIQIAIIFLIRS